LRTYPQNPVSPLQAVSAAIKKTAAKTTRFPVIILKLGIVIHHSSSRQRYE